MKNHPTQKINIANATGEDESQKKYYDQDTANINVECPPCEGDLTIQKYVKWDCSGDYSKEIDADINDWVSFKLYVNNTGDIPLDISVRDELPIGLTYIEDTTTISGISPPPSGLNPEINILYNYLYWNWTNVPAGVKIKIEFFALVNDCGIFINIANATGEDESQKKYYDEDISTVNVECSSNGCTLTQGY